MAEYKNLIGLTLLPMAILAGIAATCLSRRLRDLFFFLLVVLTPMTQGLDVNFLSREWYRGTTRGFEFSLMDILSLSILFSSLLRPHRGQSRWYWPASLGWMLLFFFYACFSVAISDPKLFGLFELTKMLRGIIVFLAAALFIRTNRELGLLAVALGCALALLFPAISVTDDLHPAIVALEATAGKRHVCQLVAQLGHVRTSTGKALANFAVAVLPRGFTGCEFVSGDLACAADELNASFRSTHSSGRSPPAAFL